MLIEAAINGARTRAEHPAIPVTPEQQAAEARGAVQAGAGAIHVHVRDAHGQESLAPGDVARTLDAIRATCPAIPVGVSTGAWIVPRLSERLAFIRGWEALPDFASVNLHEEGAPQIIRLLLDKGIGVEAGIWNAQAAHILLSAGVTDDCLRILLEPAEDRKDPRATLEAIEAVLGRVSRPRLLHGVDAPRGSSLSWRRGAATTRARGSKTRWPCRTGRARTTTPRWLPRRAGSSGSASLTQGRKSCIETF